MSDNRCVNQRMFETVLVRCSLTRRHVGDCAFGFIPGGEALRARVLQLERMLEELRTGVLASMAFTLWEGERHRCRPGARRLREQAKREAMRIDVLLERQAFDRPEHADSRKRLGVASRRLGIR